MKTIREIAYWTLALIFAGVMVVGAIGYFEFARWAAPFVNLTLFCGGFAGCAWASNRTCIGQRMTRN